MTIRVSTQSEKKSTGSHGLRMISPETAAGEDTATVEIVDIEAIIFGIQPLKSVFHMDSGDASIK